MQRMNLKHEMFWNYEDEKLFYGKVFMNLKHEMFWNTSKINGIVYSVKMNLKHEMFWNVFVTLYKFSNLSWTLNMKCFEIIVLAFALRNF
mgnify:CR=1 FL=1